MGKNKLEPAGYDYNGDPIHNWRDTVKSFSCITTEEERSELKKAIVMKELAILERALHHKLLNFQFDYGVEIKGIRLVDDNEVEQTKCGPISPAEGSKKIKIDL